jgi:hypothetical protein
MKGKWQNAPLCSGTFKPQFLSDSGKTIILIKSASSGRPRMKESTFCFTSKESFDPFHVVLEVRTESI